jgi:hypothetical protein
MKKLKIFCVLLIVFGMMSNADATPLKWRADLTVDSIDGSVLGISTGDQFVATFEVEPLLFDKPDGVQEGRFVSFDLTIGGVNWNESQPHTSPQFLLSPGGIGAIKTTVTITTRAHPDLFFFLPQSPATWEVKDEPDVTGRPIFGGDFGGTYTVSPVPEPATMLLFGAGLVGLAGFGRKKFKK